MWSAIFALPSPRAQDGVLAPNGNFLEWHDTARGACDTLIICNTHMHVSYMYVTHI